MMDVAIYLLVAGLVVISAALAVARIRERRRLEESQRKLVESRREFGKSIERLFRIVVAQKSAADSRESTHPPPCGENRDNRIETR